MKTIISLTVRFLLFGLIFISFAGCENDNLVIEEIEDDLEVNEIEKKITVSLMERDDYGIFDKTVILYDDENYLIKTPLVYFLTNLSDLNNLFSNYDSYLSTLEKIASDSQTNNLLYSSSYFGDKTDYIVAGFLLNGLCYFYDKENEENIQQVEIEYYSSNPAAGQEKRKFYINHVLFMETADSFIEYKRRNFTIGGEIEEKITVSLIESDDDAIFEKTVILFENENYLIKTPLFHFLSNMDNYYFVIRCDEYLSSLEKVISAGKTQNLLYSSSYFNKHRIDYVLTGFLETGLCYIYDKGNKDNVKQIEVEYWGYVLAPLAGAGGRKFYINNVLFIEILDWIS